MTAEQALGAAIHQGWHDYQMALIRALEPLTAEQLALRPVPRLRSIGMIATHMIGARARWFFLLMGEGGDDFKAMGKWERRGARPRRAEELVSGLQRAWDGMQAAIARWTLEQWGEAYPGDAGEPETITRR